MTTSMSPGLVGPTTGWTRRWAPVFRTARSVSSWCARCMGFRVLKATTRETPSSSKCRRSWAGVNRRSSPWRPSAGTARGRTSRRPLTYHRWVRCSSWSTLGCAGSQLPNTACASLAASTRHAASSARTARRCPSGSRSARCPHDSARWRVSSSTSRVTGMGHSLPSARRIRSHTSAWSALSMKPVSGEKAPVASSSTSQRCRSVRTRSGQSGARRSSSTARSRPTSRSTSRPPCGADRPRSPCMRPLTIPRGHGPLLIRLCDARAADDSPF